LVTVHFTHSEGSTLKSIVEPADVVSASTGSASVGSSPSAGGVPVVVRQTTPVIV
jgi:hypothetical protein